MKKLLMATSVALALGGAAPASAVLIDFDGAGPGGSFNVGALDWAPTSFAAVGGNSAIANFLAGACPPGGCTFDVYVHARLIGATDPGGNVLNITGLNANFEWTMIARVTEVITGATVLGTTGIATFATVPSAGGFLQVFYDTALNAVDVSGSGFNDGRLILSGTDIGVASGIFTVDGSVAPVALDQSPNGNQYAGQLTVTGTGSNTAIPVGGLTQDNLFFLSALDIFGILFANISQGLPYTSVDPSDCYSQAPSVVAVGGTTVGAQRCAPAHVNGLMSANAPDANGGFVPNIGGVNGLLVGANFGPDFIAQTDFNSPLRGVPEPGTLALLGAMFGALGFGMRRRKSS